MIKCFSGLYQWVGTKLPRISKLKNAANQLSSMKVPLDEFARQMRVSIPTLRSAHRFGFNEIKVARDEETGIDMIWMEDLPETDGIAGAAGQNAIISKIRDYLANSETDAVQCQAMAKALNLNPDTVLEMMTELIKYSGAPYIITRSTQKPIEYYFIKDMWN